MSKHTPGPWTYQLIAVGSNFEAAAEVNPAGKEDDFRICTAYDEAGGDDDTMEANARLIAASPDLLAVLNRYSLPLTGNYAADCHEFGTEQVEREVARRDAIAKATGDA